ncbi:bifunctional UDP-3-O-[3-hydroxymyristoyl] N-acetylglucosamine deacetylase/3-hydroxyacyl-ACP dehydratase [Verrucomicrobia bacterium]|nr:bifunctional UDP-3-O-[3-hydroxymyristoyl] N-acetylglucosamine deacetylase/3-hydroxyacyl-ACP dehydratase [Verrucomicrobiota bacterium]
MANQQTLERPASFAGLGLHSGNRVTMKFLPAEPNTGIRFRRVDLQGSPEIDASIDYVTETNRNTTLSKGNIKLQTVEHVLATFAGFGIDNAIVELDSNEPPVGDGSARPYCKMIDSAGISTQAESRDVFKVQQPLEIRKGESHYTVFPHDGFKVTCTSADKTGRHTEYLSLEITPDSWAKEIAHARTFCFFEEIEFLIKKGLIKGGSLANAIVIRDDAVLTTEPLRYREEFVRHKILDIIGDLALLGKPVQGHVIAVCPGHEGNAALTRELHQQMTLPAIAQTSFSPPAETESKSEEKTVSKTNKVPSARRETLMDVNQIMQVIPHRYPILMLDRVVEIDGNHIIAEKNVTFNEPHFQGHFPGHPIMPGVLQLEAIAQLAGLLMYKNLAKSGKIAYFMAAEKVKWRKPVRPGDILTIDVNLTRCKGKIGKASGQCLVDGEVVSEANVTFVLMDQ